MHLEAILSIPPRGVRKGTYPRPPGARITISRPREEWLRYKPITLYRVESRHGKYALPHSAAQRSYCFRMPCWTPLMDGMLAGSWYVYQTWVRTHWSEEMR